MILLAVPMITLIMPYHILARFEFQLRDKRDTEIQRWVNLRNTKSWVFFPLCMTSRKIFQELLHLENLNVQIH